MGRQTDSAPCRKGTGMSKRIKRLCVIMLALCIAAGALSSCGKGSETSSGGKLSFHDITAVIPEGFTWVSSESTDDLWVFEKGGYEEVLIFSRNDFEKTASDTLLGLMDFYNSTGGSAELGAYLGGDALMASYEQDGLYCREITFIYGNSLYAIALRGGTQEDFNALLRGVDTPDTAGIG